MLFPEAEEYREWFARAGFEQFEAVTLGAPWHSDGEAPYAIAMRGVKPAAGPSPLSAGAQARGPVGSAGR